MKTEVVTRIVLMLLLCMATAAILVEAGEWGDPGFTSTPTSPNIGSFPIMVLGIASTFFSLIVALVSRPRPANEFIPTAKKHLWTEKIFKAKGWNRAILFERSGDMAQATLNYLLSASNVVMESPQWAALSLFNAAICMQKLNEEALRHRMLRLAAILYERSFEPLMATFPEAAAWSASESGRCYMLVGDVDNATRMFQTAEQIFNRLTPLRQVRLVGQELAVLPDTITSKIVPETDRGVSENIEQELRRLESAVGVAYTA